MTIAFIGAGHLATHLSAALQEAGHEIVCVFSRTEASAKTLAAQLHCQAATKVEDVPEVEVYIFALKDDVLEAIAKRFSQSRPNTFFVHTAGSMPLSVLGGHKGGCGVLYPMQSFSKGRRADFRRIPVFIEGDSAETTARLQKMAESISDSVTELNSERRKLMHLAAVFANNFANGCYALAEELMAKAGVPFELMLPLIDETARKVHEMQPRAAQTGPAKRQDEGVMAEHERFLSDNASALAVYKAMSQSIARREKTVEQI